MESSTVICLLFIMMSVVVLAQDKSLDKIWGKYKVTHSKNYTDSEEQYRRKTFEQHVDIIRMHNLEYDLGLHTYTMGINEYADMTREEYGKFLLGARRELSGEDGKSRNKLFQSDNTEVTDDDMDWREYGYVTPIKNQGRCGSCWAFSSTGSLEGQHFRATGDLISLSEQNLVDCCKWNAGCGGGWMDNSFKYVEQNGGIDTEEYYPYQGKETGRCTYNPEDRGSTCDGWVDIPKHESALLKASSQIGPITVAIDAAHQSFQLYKSGVYVEPECSNHTSDHAVLVIGYGSEEGQDYWLVKNSWGTSWGDQGFIKMARNMDNMCAIATYASYPIVKKT